MASKSSRFKPEAEQSNVNPACTLDPRVFSKINRPHIAISRAIRNHRRFAIPRMAGRPCPLTAERPGCQLEVPEATWPAPSRSERRCGRYPPLHVPAFEPGLAWPLESIPENQPVEKRKTLLAVHCQTFPENGLCVRASHLAGARRRATVPVIPSSTRILRSTRLC